MKSLAATAILLILMASTFAFVSSSANAGNDQAVMSKSKPTSQRVRPSGRVSDPNIGATCAYDRAAGRCMIDLGNGRCMECNAGPMK